MGPNFVCSISLNFQKISNNPLKHFTFSQKSIEFHNPKLETPQPVLP